MTAKRAHKPRVHRNEPLTASLGEIAQASAPRVRRAKKIVEEVTFFTSALRLASDALRASKNFVSQRRNQVALAGFGAGIGVVTALLLKREKAAL